MKIEISIDRESKSYELKALSIFAEFLANGRHIEEVPDPVSESPNQKETGKVVMFGKGVSEFATEMAKAEVAGEGHTQQSKIEALADKVAEATQVKEEEEAPESPGEGLTYHTVDAVCAMSEEEMKAVPTQVLYDILTGHFNVDPAERPGKNTNAKLRGLLLSAINAEAKEEETVAEEENASQEQAIEPQEAEEVPEDAAPAEDFPEVTIEMLREKATELIRLKKRQVVADAFAACGATNFGTLSSERYNDFYALICQA